MNAKELFDAEEYFRCMVSRNILAQEKAFFFCTCSGPQNLEGCLDGLQQENAFVCMDDTSDGALFQGKSGGWYKKRTFTVFILHRHEFNNMDDRREKLSLCRRLFHQMVSKMIVDADDLSNELVYLQTSSVMSREIGRYALSGCTGLYFMVDVNEPLDLVYTPEEWN